MGGGVSCFMRTCSRKYVSSVDRNRPYCVQIHGSMPMCNISWKGLTCITGTEKNNLCSSRSSECPSGQVYKKVANRAYTIWACINEDESVEVDRWYRHRALRGINGDQSSVQTGEGTSIVDDVEKLMLEDIAADLPLN